MAMAEALSSASKLVELPASPSTSKCYHEPPQISFSNAHTILPCRQQGRRTAFVVLMGEDTCLFYAIFPLLKHGARPPIHGSQARPALARCHDFCGKRTVATAAKLTMQYLTTTKRSFTLLIDM